MVTDRFFQNLDLIEAGNLIWGNAKDILLYDILKKETERGN